jgi:hypothetical protein
MSKATTLTQLKLHALRSANYTDKRIAELSEAVEKALEDVSCNSGLFAFEVDEEGNLYVITPDGETPPDFEYDAETGNLYIVLEGN